MILVGLEFLWFRGWFRIFLDFSGFACVFVGLLGLLILLFWVLGFGCLQIGGFWGIVLV